MIYYKHEKGIYILNLEFGYIYEFSSTTCESHVHKNWFITMEQNIYATVWVNVPNHTISLQKSTRKWIKQITRSYCHRQKDQKGSFLQIFFLSKWVSFEVNYGGDLFSPIDDTWQQGIGHARGWAPRVAPCWQARWLALLSETPWVAPRAQALPD